MNRTARQKITTLVVPVPEVGEIIEPWRSRYDWSAGAGVPAHITVLGPFLPPGEITPGVLERLESLFGARRALTFGFTTVERLPGLVYLAPEPVAPFQELTAMVENEWPEAPRFGTRFTRPLYHLTIARDVDVCDEVREALSSHLPMDVTGRAAFLLESRLDAGVRTLGVFPFDA